jgi:hypothetical protein
MCNIIAVYVDPVVLIVGVYKGSTLLSVMFVLIPDVVYGRRIRQAPSF